VSTGGIGMLIDDASDPGSWRERLSIAWYRQRMHVEDWPLRMTYRTEEGETVEVEETGTYQAITVSCDEHGS